MLKTAQESTIHKTTAEEGNFFSLFVFRCNDVKWKRRVRGANPQSAFDNKMYIMFIFATKIEELLELSLQDK